MSLTKNLLRFAWSLRLMLTAIVICALAFSFYSIERNAIRAANENRTLSLQLIQELRQSSDDLTRMVRTFVATGDQRYRDQYDEVLAIRDGLSPRPEEYESIYWDLVLDERRPTLFGAVSPLLQRMEEAGYTVEELNRLAVAKQNSDTLVSVERQAMDLMDSIDATGAQQLQAIRLLHDARYHRAKADVMRPIAETSRMVIMRTTERIARAERIVLGGLILIVLSGVLLVLTLVWTYRNLQTVFGGSLSQLQAAIQATTSAEAPIVQLAGNGDRESIIGKLVEAQQVRASDEERRKDSERAVSEAERHLRSVVGALDDGVCVVQDALIRFVNPRFQQILERQEADLVDIPYFQFVHEDDRNMLIDRYRKRMTNIPVEPEVEFRVRTQSGALRQVISRGTEFEWAGRPATLYFITMVEKALAG